MSDKIREAFKVAADAAGIKDGTDRLALWAWWLKAWKAALAQQPAAAVPEDLHARCAEIIAWQKTGVLKGDALRGYARAQWYADEHNSLQMAEADTARQAYALLVASSPAYQQPAAAVPDGWKLVPVRATREQVNAVCMHPDLARTLYRNMVEAAPAAPESTQEPVAFYWQDLETFPMTTRRHGPYFGWPSEDAIARCRDYAKPVPIYAAPPTATAAPVPAAQEPSKLEKLLAEEERSHGITIDQRDRAEDWATKLAEAVGEHFGIDVGEHSSANCPWENALELLNTAPPAEQPDTVPVPRELLRMAWRLIPGAEGMSEEQQAEHAA